MGRAEDRIPALIDEVAPHLFVVTINGINSHPAKTTAAANPLQTLDQGSYDVGPLLKKLNAVGFKGPIGLQCWNIKGDPEDAADPLDGRLAS